MGKQVLQNESTIPVATIALIAIITLLADTGYYYYFQLIGLTAGYNNQPILAAAYYAIWSGIAAGIFWPTHKALVLNFVQPVTAIILIGIIVGLAMFAFYILPILPKIRWTEPWQAPELMSVTPAYFMPKAIEILFQQMLIAALVFSLSRNFSLRDTSIICAVLFGFAHTLLAFGDFPFGYVIRFIIAASIFGAIFPYLFLKFSNGFAYSYSVHWLYYLVTIVMAHTLSPYSTG